MYMIECRWQRSHQLSPYVSAGIVLVVFLPLYARDLSCGCVLVWLPGLVATGLPWGNPYRAGYDLSLGPSQEQCTAYIGGR